MFSSSEHFILTIVCANINIEVILNLRNTNDDKVSTAIYRYQYSYSSRSSPFHIKYFHNLSTFFEQLE
jgi:hypothetical protein